MSAGPAVNGRDAMACAPSLPPPAPGSVPPGAGVTEQVAAAVLAGLSQLPASRLADAGAWAADAADRALVKVPTRFVSTGKSGVAIAPMLPLAPGGAGQVETWVWRHAPGTP